MKGWKLILLLALGILVLSFSLRVINLTILPVFADEAIYIRWAQVMRAVPELRFLPLSDGKQPLFMWAIIPFFKVFSNPLFAGRILSVLCGVSTTIGVGVLTYILFVRFKPWLGLFRRDDDWWYDPKAASLSLVSVFFYAISPFAAFFDRMALADAMLSMFGIWTFIFTILAVRYRRLDCALIAGFMLGGAALTKSPSLYFQILLPSTLLLVEWPKENAVRFKEFVQRACLLLVTFLLSLGFYNILRLGSNFQMLSSRNLDYVYPLSHLWERPLDPLKPFLMEVVRWLWTMGPSVLIFLVVGGVLLNIKKFPRQILFLIIVAFVPIFVSAEFAKVFTARYIFFSIPYLMILGATFFSAIWKKDGDVNLLHHKGVQVLLGLIFIMHSLFIDYLYLNKPQAAPLPRSERSGYLEEWTAGYGIHEISDYVRKEQAANPNEKIVIGTEGYFGTLPDGLQMYLNDMPSITVIGVGQPIRNVHQSLLESKKAGNETYLVVNSTRFLGDADKLGLHLVQSFPKATKPDGIQENLLFFAVD